MRLLRPAVGSVLPCGLALLALAAGSPLPPERVSIGHEGVEADGDSGFASVSANGRFVAFRTDAQNLLAVSAGGSSNVYVRDRDTGLYALVSATAVLRVGGNGDSGTPSISANGRVVVFSSVASDLLGVGADALGRSDVFRADLKTGEILRLSSTADGAPGDNDSTCRGASVSANGRYAVFSSDAANLVDDDLNGRSDVFLYDAVEGTLALLSRTDAGAPANGDSTDASISPNGRFVAYASDATDLAEGGSGLEEIFVHDTRTGATARVTRALTEIQPNGDSRGAVVSDNGRFVAFLSQAANLVAVDGNGESDTFLADRKKGVVRMVSVGAGGVQGDGGSFEAALSANGKTLVFWSETSNLHAADANGSGGDVYRVDLKSGALTMLSATALGAGGDGGSVLAAPALSSNGKWLAFATAAGNFDPADLLGHDDVYLVRLK